MSKEMLEQTALYPNIGERLKQARDALHLTTAQVAERLHLASRVIEALENNQFNEHPGIAFMRGYLFSYVRFLELSEDDFIKDFASLELDTVLPQSHVIIHPPLYHKKPGWTERYLRWMTLLVVIVILVLGVTWWRSHRIEETNIHDLLKQNHVLLNHALPNPHTNAVPAPVVAPSSVPIAKAQVPAPGAEQKQAALAPPATPSVKSVKHAAADKTDDTDKTASADDNDNEKLLSQST